LSSSNLVISNSITSGSLILNTLGLNGAQINVISNGYGAVINLDASASSGYNYRIFSSQSGAGEGPGKFFIQNATLGTYPFSIATNGNVLIGYAGGSSSYKLDVNGSINCSSINTTNLLLSNITTSNLNTINSTISSLVTTNISSSNINNSSAIISLNLSSTNITTTSLLATTSISSANVYTVNNYTKLLHSNNNVASFSPGDAVIACNGITERAHTFFQANGENGLGSMWMVQSGSTCSNKIFFYNSGDGNQNSIGVNTSGNMILNAQNKISITSPLTELTNLSTTNITATNLIASSAIGTVNVFAQTVYSTGGSFSNVSSTRISAGNIIVDGGSYPTGGVTFNVNSQIFSDTSSTASNLKLTSYGGNGITIASGTGDLSLSGKLISTLNYTHYTMTGNFSWPNASDTLCQNWKASTTSGEQLSYSAGVFTNNLSRTIFLTFTYTGARNSNSFGDSKFFIEANGYRLAQSDVSGTASVSLSANISLTNGSTIKVYGYQTSGSGNDFYANGSHITVLIHH